MANSLPILTSEQRIQMKAEREQKIADFIAENTQQANYLKLIPVNQRWLFYKIYQGENSMKKATKAKCLDCSQFDKEEIRSCNIVSCPLYNFRPYKKESK